MSRSVQPFQVGVISVKECLQDKNLVLTETDLPHGTYLYVDKSFFYDTDETFVVDFTQLGEIDFLFLPLIPKSVELYSLWSAKNDT